jgi:hypothetical protein
VYTGAAPAGDASSGTGPSGVTDETGVGSALTTEPARPRRGWPSKHQVLIAAAICLPIVLVLSGAVLVLANLSIGDDTPPARPARPSVQTAVPPTAAQPPTVAASLPSAVPALDPQRHAIELAERLASDLARHDYAAARAMAPFAQTDEALVIQYQPVTQLIVVGVGTVPVGPSMYLLRLGLIANQSVRNISTTAFYCVEWTVDSARETIVLGGALTLKTLPGTLTAADFPQFVAQCRAATLP